MMKLFLNSQKGTHSAIAEYNKYGITVLAGSRINTIVTYNKIPSDVLEKRTDKNIVDENGVVKQNVVFASVSAAAQFVTGRSSNGYIAWRPDNKMSLKEYLGKGKKASDY